MKQIKAMVMAMISMEMRQRWWSQQQISKQHETLIDLCFQAYYRSDDGCDNGVSVKKEENNTISQKGWKKVRKGTITYSKDKVKLFLIIKYSTAALALII